MSILANCKQNTDELIERPLDPKNMTPHSRVTRIVLGMKKFVNVAYFERGMISCWMLEWQRVNAWIAFEISCSRRIHLATKSPTTTTTNVTFSNTTNEFRFSYFCPEMLPHTAFTPYLFYLSIWSCYMLNYSEYSSPDNMIGCESDNESLIIRFFRQLPKPLSNFTSYNYWCSYMYSNTKPSLHPLLGIGLPNLLPDASHLSHSTKSKINDEKIKPTRFQRTHVTALVRD